ncbi:MAG: hypothetical protein U0K70_03800 [Acutalibacteraceae bacterium]|nr:hypothetical protein [Acutalibacteraceae bacterium]
MAEKKTNEILEEQRRARQEFLELKKMQSGEMKAPPKPSEVAIVPKTPKEKWDNFWFQYKWYVVAIVATVAVLTVLIAQCATKTKYDLQVVYFTYTTALDEQTEGIADYLQKYAEDTNGDGEINVQVVNVSFSNTTGDSQYRYTMLSKLQAMLTGDENAMLYITDSETYEYINSLTESGAFLEGEPLKFSEEFYTATESEQFGRLPEGLQISCRRISETTMQNKKQAAKAYESAKKLLEKLKSASQALN